MVKLDFEGHLWDYCFDSYPKMKRIWANLLKSKDAKLWVLGMKHLMIARLLYGWDKEPPICNGKLAVFHLHSNNFVEGY